MLSIYNMIPILPMTPRVPSLATTIFSLSISTPMSEPPSSEAYLASALQDDGAAPEHESFQKFYERWITEQSHHLNDLITAASTVNNNDQQQEYLAVLVNRVHRHYEHYYKAKSQWVDRDVLPMLRAAWRSTLEDSFLWLGGWRPTMAFHLLYSKSGLQMETRLAELTQGLGIGNIDLGGLSPSQLRKTDELQRRTVREERAVSERMAERGGGGDGGGEEERVESAIKGMREGLVGVVKRADNLRLRTFKSVIELLTPIQAVHFLIAAAELHLKIREWGEKRDADQHRNQQDQQTRSQGGGPNGMC
ncbi:hypothetical protein Sjap_021575 [Stephania japonica]|uniref:DOG1 domain-containing protein n=1 Tax=Stephania japonica TaxID=461633 RepID=A0AAP0ESW5_9MAGN